MSPNLAAFVATDPLGVEPLSGAQALTNATPARPFQFAGSAGGREQAANCLAAAAWYEAGTDAEGQRAVIQVILNRLHHPSFPNTVCAVVLQGSERKTGCQFTFTCDGSIDRRRPGPASWGQALQRAELALNGSVDTKVLGATHYHADYVTPWWSSSLVNLAKVGSHIFYGWPGARGALTGNPFGQSTVSLAAYSRLLPNGRALAGAGVDPVEDQMGTAIPAASDAELAAARIAETELSLAPLPYSSVMALDQAKPSGRWAMTALDRCGDTGGCRIYGYTDGAAATRNSFQPPADRDLPQFILIRDSSSGQIQAWWDCDVAQRPDASQCLPRSSAEVRSLMRVSK